MKDFESFLNTSASIGQTDISTGLFGDGEVSGDRGKHGKRGNDGKDTGHHAWMRD